MPTYRYPGIRPFTVEDHEIFFGRDSDIDRLSSLIMLENMVILHGRSGLGKSSLLNAGVIPKIPKEHCNEIIQMRFGYHNPENSISPLENLFKLLSNPADNFIFQKLIKLNEITDNKLWYLFKSKQISQNENKFFVVIFDQFEELFTYPIYQIEQFKKELSGLLNLKMPQQLRNLLREKIIIDKNFLNKEETTHLYESLKIKIVFSIRTDKLSFLYRISDYFPNILKNCYELLPLSIDQAIRAIIEPAKIRLPKYLSQPFEYTPTAIKKIIDFLTDKGKTKILTFLLQMVCQYAENLVIRNPHEVISENDLGDLGEITTKYYSNIIEQLDITEQLPSRKLIEEGLIFEEDEHRLSLYESQIFRDYKISPDSLQKLVGSQLLMIDTGGLNYELSHDAFVLPILKAKRERIQKEENEREIFEFKSHQKALFIKLGIGVLSVFFLIIFSGIIIHSNYKNNMDRSKAKYDKIKAMHSLDSMTILNNRLKQAEINRKEDSIKTIDSKIENYKNKGLQLYEQKKYDEAKSKLDSAYLVRKDLSTLNLKIEIQETQKNEYNELIKDGDDLQNKGIEFLYQSKSKYLKAKEINVKDPIADQKIELINKKISLSFDSLKTRGMIYYNAKGFYRAITEFRKAKQLIPDDANININIIKCDSLLNIK
jgi:hypothetical protein